MAVILGTESPLYFPRQSFSFRTARCMIEIHVSLVVPGPTVYMDKYGTLVAALILPVHAVHRITALLQTGYLIQRNGLSHASFPLAVIQNSLVTNSILCILNDKMHFCPTFHQLASQAENNVVSILIFMQLFSTIFANAARIRSPMSTDKIESGSFQRAGSYRIRRIFLSKQRFIMSLLFSRHSRREAQQATQNQT